MPTAHRFFELTGRFSRGLPGLVRAAATAALAGLWLWLYRPVFSYLAIIFSAEDFRTNQLVLLGVSFLIISRLWRSRVRPRLDAGPQLYLPGLGLALGGSGLYLLAERFLDVNTLSASLFGLASYGLLGLWLPARRWRQGFPAALLIIGALPFGEHMQTFIGYPVRILTAAVVRDGLAAAGVASVGIDTILVLENGVSQVDLPCSGVKSLWTGMLFLMAATWIEGRPLNWRWFVVAVIFAGLLLAANVARVSILVAAGQAAGWRLLAEMLHVPLGVLGFVAACAAAVGLLRLQPALASPRPDRAKDQDDQGRPLWLAPALAAVVLVMGLVYAPRPQTGLADAPPAWRFPAGLMTEPMPLRADEIDWLTRDGAESADRRRFEWRGMTGSMILITSTTWRAHHRPERCFEVYGLSLEDSRTHLVNREFPLRLVHLGDSRGRRLLTAAYWFQSAGRTTDDYASRIWADLAPERDRWVLVSILFDGAPDMETVEMQTFFKAMHQAIGRSLAREPIVSRAR